MVKQESCMYVYKSTLKQHTLLDVRNTYKHSITNYVARHATKKKDPGRQFNYVTMTLKYLSITPVVCFASLQNVFSYASVKLHS